MDDGDRMTVPFSVEIVLRDHGPEVWRTARVDIFEGSDAAARQIGSYERNHAGWCAETFAPFMLDGRWFALYAPEPAAFGEMTRAGRFSIWIFRTLRPG
jgi:hypothetical protein